MFRDVSNSCRYVLLRGRKRFRLWDPSVAPRMPTVGRVAAIHPNGRIVYQGQVCVSVQSVLGTQR
jgi:hypothetical protein